MRVTNSMISNSAMQHISTAKNKLLTAEEQYTTEKKIQRASDDPTIASRSLKYRNTLAQLTQYVEKNVQDAMDWMDMTESAMSNVSSLLTNMKGYLNQGVNGYIEVDERNAILAQLQQYTKSIFKDEANQDYAGRYLFTGYRTDTSLLFSSDTDNLEYQITEKFEYSDVNLIRNVTSNIHYEEGFTSQEYAQMETKTNHCYRLQLAYQNCSNTGMTTEDGQADPFTIQISVNDVITETYSADNGTVGVVASTDPNAYDIAAYNQANGTDFEVLYLYDAGDVVFGENLYGQLQQNEAQLSINYAKKEFESGDIRPEMYFETTSYNTVSMKTIEYSDPDGQNIDYEVNVRQTITVNTQAKDAFDTEIYRALDYIKQAIVGVNDVETKIEEIEKKIANTDPNETETLDALEVLKSAYEDEKQLRTAIMNDAFGIGLSAVDRVQDVVNVAVAELGAKYNRMQLTYDKLLDQQTTSEEQLSNNEDVEISDAIINLTQADNLYQSSLSATSKILGNTLLNYI